MLIHYRETKLKDMASGLGNVDLQNAGGADVSLKGDSLVSRMRLDPKKDGDFVPLPGSLLRKYIAYARTYVFPR